VNNWQDTPPGTREALDMQTININENFYTSDDRNKRVKELEVEGFIISLLAKPWMKKDRWIYSLSAAKYLYRESEEGEELKW